MIEHIHCDIKVNRLQYKQEREEYKMIFLCYKRCSTCQKAKKWLDAQGITYQERPIAEEAPTYEELKEWYQKSQLPLKKFFNTSGKLYKELQLKDKLASMSEDEQLQLLASDGMLVKRPIVVNDHLVLVGFQEEKWNKLKKF